MSAGVDWYINFLITINPGASVAKKRQKKMKIRLQFPGTEISDLKFRAGKVTGEDFTPPAEEDPSAP